jgi:hypothetical protein
MRTTQGLNVLHVTCTWAMLAVAAPAGLVAALGRGPCKRKKSHSREMQKCHFQVESGVQGGTASNTCCVMPILNHTTAEYLPVHTLDRARWPNKQKKGGSSEVSKTQAVCAAPPHLEQARSQVYRTSWYGSVCQKARRRSGGGSRAPGPWKSSHFFLWRKFISETTLILTFRSWLCGGRWSSWTGPSAFFLYTL